MNKPASYVAKLELAERRLDLLDLKALAAAFGMTLGELADFLMGDGGSR